MPALQPLSLTTGAEVLANAKAVHDRLWPKVKPVFRPAVVPAAPKVSLDDATRVVAASFMITPAEVLLRLSHPVFQVETGRHTAIGVKAAVASAFGVSVQEVDSDSRNVPIVRVRHFAIALAKHLTGQSTPAIGRRFGGMDHSSIIHASRKFALIISELSGELSDTATTEDWARAGYAKITKLVAQKEQEIETRKLTANSDWRKENKEADRLRRRLNISIHEARERLGITKP